MVTLSASGTATTVIGTEVTVYNPTTARRFDGYLDLTNMAASDILEVRVYVLLDVLGSYKQYYVQTYNDAQTPNPVIYIPILPSDIGYKITVKQTAGSVRTIDWRIYEV